MMTCGHITVEDFSGTQSTIIINHVLSLDSLEAIVDFVRRYSEARVVNYKFEQIVFVTDDVANNFGAYDTVEQSLNMKYRNKTNGEYLWFVLPAPGESTLNDQQANTSAFANDLKFVLEQHTTHHVLVYCRGGLNSFLPIDTPS